MPFTMRLGPFRFDSRRGTFALRTRRLTLESRTRSERKAKKARRVHRRAERRIAQIEAMNAARRAWCGEPDPTPTRSATGRQSPPRLEETGRRAGVRGEPVHRTSPRTSTEDRPPVGQGSTGPLVISPTGQVQTRTEPTTPVARPQPSGAGRCGERTADGTPCRRRGKCPSGTHAKR